MSDRLKKVATVLAVVVLAGVMAMWLASGEGVGEDMPQGSHGGGHQVQQQPANTDASFPPSAHAQASQSRFPPTGRADPAAQAFIQSQTCYFATSHVNVVREAMASCDALEGIEAVAATYQQCLVERPQLEQRLSKLEEQARGCQGSAEETRTAYYLATKVAAAQGNLDAQLCYLQSAFGPEMNYTDQDLREYLQDAPRYAQSGIARGDWRVVEVLGTTRFDLGSGLLPNLVKGDIKTAYQMNRLARLGASGEYARKLDNEVARELFSLSRTGPDALTPQQRAEAEARARDLYRKYFSRSQTVAERPIPCKSP